MKARALSPRRPAPAPPREDLDTKRRILHAAAEIFAERGFKATTVREICSRARASVAAVNYYFQGKEPLYAAVLADLIDRGFTLFPVEGAAPSSATGEERLHAFVRALVFRLLGTESWSGLKGRGRLLAREIAEPSPFLESVIETRLRPQKDVLVDILRTLAAGRGDEETLRRCARSIVGQCLHYAFASTIMERLDLGIGNDPETLEELSRHIAEFSLGGMERVLGHGASS
jgi:AcrR family transcriptional regulator